MSNSNSAMSEALKYGTLLGAIQVLLTLLLYVAGVEIMVKWWVSILIIIISIVLVSSFGIKWRKSVGGFATFGEMFKFLFPMYIVMIIISTLFNVLLYNVIDTNLAANMQELVIENTEAMMEKFGAPEEAIDQTMVEMEKFAEKFTPLALLKQMFWSIIFGGVLTLIISAIIKKKNKDIFNEEIE